MQLNANLEARMKYIDTPEKFMDSELDLHEAVKNLQLIAAQPQFFPDLVKLSLHVSGTNHDTCPVGSPGGLLTLFLLIVSQC